MRTLLAGPLLALTLSPGLAAQEAPRVVSLDPPHLAADVDAKARTLTVTFDRAMGAGRSLVGGGPNFPKVVEATWKNPKTFLVTVELQPDHDYHLGLNSHTFTNFRSADGVPLAPVPWSFTTLPQPLPDQREQRKRNRTAFDELQRTLAASYSYYDLRVKDWRKLFAAARRELLAAPTDVAWAAAAARALEPTADIHMSLQLGQRTWPTGRRAVDPLLRANLLAGYLPTEQTADGKALFGRSHDGIGYLLVATWTDAVDLDAVERALAALRDCKAMVIDARLNAGGSEDLARRIAAWFVDGTKVYARSRYRERPGARGFGPVLDRAIEGNREPERRFTGPIAVLTSRYVMSSNEAFVLMLRQAPDCVQVGQPTYGSSGNPKPHELANGVTLVMPSWQALRPDGTCFEGEGIAPDVTVEVSARDLETRDPILDKALALLRAKVAK